MKYTRIQVRSIISQTVPDDKKPRFTDEQIDKIKTAGAITLTILGIAGVITLSAVAPNVLSVLGRTLFKNSRNKRFTKKQKVTKVARTFYYLKDRGYIKMKPSGKDFKIFLTKLGKRRLKKLEFEHLTITKPKKWDGKWWQIAADIPTEDYKWAADLFREKLMLMNFFPLQRTLWFFPFDPRDEIDFILSHFGIERYVTVMEINRLDRDDERKLKNFFKGQKILS